MTADKQTVKKFFDITTPTNTIRLDANRCGATAFTVTNISGRAMQGRATIMAQDSAAAVWLALAGEAERHFPVAATQQYCIEVRAPLTAPAGTYTFRLDMVDIEVPDERYTQGPSVAFSIAEPLPVPQPQPPAAKKPFPWWILAVIAAIVIMVIIGAALFSSTRAHGGKILFVSQNSVIESISSDGSRKLLTSGLNLGVNKHAPAVWSPDGRQIAFESKHEGNWEIYVMDADGNHLFNRTRNPADDLNPIWSPDNKQIAFVSGRNGNYEIYIMNADGSQPTNLTHNRGNDFYQAWSPDGKQITFVSSRDGNSEIYVMNADGKAQTNLSRNGGQDYFPRWSPDGKQIAFVSDRLGNNEIYVMNADGSQPKNLSQSPRNDEFLVWSPDGSQIAFFSDWSGVLYLEVMKADGRDRRPLAHPVIRYWLTWSPDGSQLVFASRQGGSADIFTVPATGGEAKNLTNTPDKNEIQPQWSRSE